MSRADQLRAELALAELEERFINAKAAVERCSECGRRRPGEDDAELRALKVELREARQAYREAREAR